MAVARRIIVLGPSGAGKSTLARRIGERLGIPVVHLDALYWNPGWVACEPGQFRERMAHAAARDAWVMEGNYTAHLDLRLPRADAVVWLDLPRRIYFRRALWRSIRHHGHPRDDIGPGCRERFVWSFFKDWAWTYPVHSRPQHRELMSRLSASVLTVTLTSPREVAQFERALPHSLDAASHSSTG